MATEIEKILESLVFHTRSRVIEKDERNTIAQQLELVQIPAFSNHEERRRAGFKELMEAEGYTAQMDEVNNVYTVIPGAGSAPLCMFLPIWILCSHWIHR